MFKLFTRGCYFQITFYKCSILHRSITRQRKGEPLLKLLIGLIPNCGNIHQYAPYELSHSHASSHMQSRDPDKSIHKFCEVHKFCEYKVVIKYWIVSVVNHSWVSFYITDLNTNLSGQEFVLGRKLAAFQNFNTNIKVFFGRFIHLNFTNTETHKRKDVNKKWLFLFWVVFKLF